ncbi:MAG: hypothetical protein AAF747_05625, partial [Planctomycetota bacterium]
IIALLIGILLPALGAARDTAKTVRSLAASRSLMAAYTLYSNDHDGYLLPTFLSLDQAGESTIVDDFGNELPYPINARWAFRLGPYFDYAWEGTTHVGERQSIVERIRGGSGELASLNGWPYEISIISSFGINYRYVGKDNREVQVFPGFDPPPTYFIERQVEAFDPSGLITFASSRLFITDQPVEGHYIVEPPAVDAVFDETLRHTTVASRFGWLHPRYNGKAAVGWMDGHASLQSEDELRDRRNWVNRARQLGDADWQP